MKMKRMALSVPSILSWIILGLIVGAWVRSSNAWDNPTSTPPDGNVGAPINTGSNTQVKSGGLGIGGLLQVAGTGFFQLNNNVAQADQSGAYVAAATGTAPEPGAVLTAIDSNGTAAWVKGVSTSSGGGIIYERNNNDWIYGTSTNDYPSCPDGFTIFRKYSNNLSIPNMGSRTVNTVLCSSTDDPVSYEEICYYANGGWDGNCAASCMNGYEQKDVWNSYLGWFPDSRGYDGNSSHMYVFGVDRRLCVKQQ